MPRQCIPENRNVSAGLFSQFFHRLFIFTRYHEYSRKRLQHMERRINMMKKVIALLCAAALVLSCGISALAETVSRPAPAVSEGEKYISDHLQGASALYVSGKQVTLDNTYFYGAGFASDQQITDQVPNQYGLCSVVLGAGLDTEITLNNPTIVSDPESYANGVFAAAMAKITVNGGTIDTDNSSGHGIDATYLGHVYAYDTVIHTRGETSGALATDFGGGFIVGERLDCTTEGRSSPGVFCAGSAIIYLKDSKLTTTSATGIVVAHDHSAMVIDNCVVDAAGTAVNGLQALPNPASSDGSTFFAFNSKLTSRGGAVVGESGGRTVVNLIASECTGASENAIECRSSGILTVNLWDTELTGNIDCAEGCSVTVNIYAGGKLSGEVTGDGQVEINVYNGGEYSGSFAAKQAGEGESAPAAGSFDDYLINCWASGSFTWTESMAKEYVATIEPEILQNSAAVLVAEGAAAKPYDPATYNPSESSIDLSLLNLGGAHGFSVGEVFGGSSFSGGDFSASSGMPSGNTQSKPKSSGKRPEKAASSAGVLETILGVGTTQSFTSDPVSIEDLKTIVEAGLAAASAINQQPWYFVATTNQELMIEISGSGSASAVPSGAVPGGAMPGGAMPGGAAPGGDFGGSEGGQMPGGDFGASEGGQSSGAGFGGSEGGSAAPMGGSSAKAGLGDSPAAIIIYRNDNSSSPDPDFDCGLAAQNMVIAAASLGYGVKIVSSPTMTLNGANHDALCEKMGVDPSMQAVAVLLIGYTDTDAVTSASTRSDLEEKASIIE